jgi:F-type H+-transporting ATPase subunit a
MLGKHLIASQYEPSTKDIQVPGFGSVGDVHVDTLAFTWACMAFILIAAAAVKPTLVAQGPGGTGQAIAEGLYKFLDDLQIGHKYKPFLPLIASIFIFVLTANMFGITFLNAFHEYSWWPHLPAGHDHWEVASPTTDFNVTLGLALIVLITYLGAGIKNGGWNYIKLYFGPQAPIEYMDLVIRPLTLALRLLLVITADELTRMVFLFMVPAVAPVFVMAFEIFIGLVQAFVFALLASIYIGLAVSDHH